ncbi:hypothetical protein AMTRI_Chr08g202610 [Amborella trichopoda]
MVLRHGGHCSNQPSSGPHFFNIIYNIYVYVYMSIGQIGYVIIGRIVGDSNDRYASMITYTLLYISMNLGTFARIVSFGPRTGTNNLRDYAGLYTKYPFLALS